MQTAALGPVASSLPAAAALLCARRLRAAALEAVGNLAFAPKNRTRLQGRQGLMQRVLALAQAEPAPAGGMALARVRAAAVRVLAVLGRRPWGWEGRRTAAKEEPATVLCSR